MVQRHVHNAVKHLNAALLPPSCASISPISGLRCCVDASKAGASPNQENIKGKTPIDLAKTETTLTLLCPLHYAASRSMLDNLVSLVAKVFLHGL